MRVVKPSERRPRRAARGRRRLGDLAGHHGRGQHLHGRLPRPARRALAAALPRGLRERRLHALGRARGALGRPPRGHGADRAGRHGLRAAARDARPRSTSPTPSRRSTSWRATRRPRTRSRSPGRRASGGARGPGPWRPARAPRRRRARSRGRAAAAPRPRRRRARASRRGRSAPTGRPGRSRALPRRARGRAPGRRSRIAVARKRDSQPDTAKARSRQPPNDSTVVPGSSATAWRRTDGSGRNT